MRRRKEEKQEERGSEWRGEVARGKERKMMEERER